MSTNSDTSSDSYWRKAHLPLTLSYELKAADGGFDAHDQAKISFDCEMGEQGRCTIEALGSVTLADVAAMIKDHTDVHFPVEMIAEAKAVLQGPNIPTPRPETLAQGTIVV